MAGVMKIVKTSITEKFGQQKYFSRQTRYIVNTAVLREVTQCSLVARFGGTAAFHLQHTTKVGH
jgi:hypothetical protein